MVARELRRTHLALPFGLFGLAGSWVVADFYRLDVSGPEETARGVLTLGIPLVAALLGVVLSLRAISRSALVTWIAVCLGTAFAGMNLGVLTTIVAGSRGAALAGMQTGLLTGAVFLPFAALVTAAARRVGRARPFTVVDAIDRRAPWVVTATAIAGGRSLVFAAGSFWFYSPAYHRMNHVLDAITALAGAAALLLLLADLAALMSIRRSARCAAEMQPRDPLTALPCDDIEDLGIGEEEREEICGGPAYRTTARPLRVLRGSVRLSSRSAWVALARSAAAVLVSLSSLSFCLWLAGVPPLP